MDNNNNLNYQLLQQRIKEMRDREKFPKTQLFINGKPVEEINLDRVNPLKLSLFYFLITSIHQNHNYFLEPYTYLLIAVTVFTWHTLAAVWSGILAAIEAWDDTAPRK